MFRQANSTVLSWLSKATSVVFRVTYLTIWALFESFGIAVNLYLMWDILNRLLVLSTIIGSLAVLIYAGGVDAKALETQLLNLYQASVNFGIQLLTLNIGDMVLSPLGLGGVYLALLPHAALLTVAALILCELPLSIRAHFQKQAEVEQNKATLKELNYYFIDILLSISMIFAFSLALFYPKLGWSLGLIPCAASAVNGLLKKKDLILIFEKDRFLLKSLLVRRALIPQKLFDYVNKYYYLNVEDEYVVLIDSFPGSTPKPHQVPHSSPTCSLVGPYFASSTPGYSRVQATRLSLNPSDEDLSLAKTPIVPAPTSIRRTRSAP